jgi:leucyl aminopeptidase
MQSIFLYSEVDWVYSISFPNCCALSTYLTRPDDIVRSLCGTTIEVIDTDAEGRMLLADTLTLASRKTIPPVATSLVNSRVRRPRMVIDFATLTGSCIAATTNRYISLFTNRPGLILTLLQASHKSGERAWPFPLDPIFHEDLKSDIADLMQVTLLSLFSDRYATLLTLITYFDILCICTVSYKWRS